ncbi:TetR/AcrR family transcriptional regulator [Massilia scottii]|uniref:TetR/AcrR family transcriptional regulator n=1 Tax=Massilia scottii TaxID=3057166 RepID=UPI002796C812|nr:MULTISPECIES: TetR/AcrR family transcriptional regulator [unclassified Massilia]MDQ1812858.1 TetR/AcrR family transcriptional regulator [Massilia sp. CCM 9210]MDQ1834417.1 TetR/AcrR family transcriptional regulator [Massilia sp. CCM 9029]
MQCPLEMKPRWERRKDARPQELLAAALDLFVERGFASTRLEDVAKRAGVSKGTLYLYFTNKEELFKAVVRDTIVPALGAAEDMIASFEGHSADLLRAVMMAWWENAGATKSSGMIKLVMAESNNFPDIAVFYREEVIQRGSIMISGMLERAVERGHFRPLDVFLTTQILIAPMLMLMLWKHSVGPCDMAELDPVAFIDSFLTMTLTGLLPRAPELGAAAP